MMNRTITCLGILLITFLICGGCKPGIEPPPDFRSEVQMIYQELMDEYDPEDPDSYVWPYTYHPMIHAAWIYKGRQDVDRSLKNRLKKGLRIFGELNDNLTAQVDEGVTRLDAERFLYIIFDTGIRGRTGELIEEEITPLNAYARAFMEDVVGEFDETPETILRILGKEYTDRPEICEVPDGEAVEDEDTKWRDWLHIALAAIGEDGVETVIKWNDKIEGLQELVPDQDFWEGRLTHAYTLRTIQLARGEAIYYVVDELLPYGDGGKVSGFHKWMYWNIAWMAFSGGGMYPYSDSHVLEITLFLGDGLLEGPMGEGEEAEVIAEALGRAPSDPFASILFNLVLDRSNDCKRRQLGYSALANMFYVPIEQWAPDFEQAITFRDGSVDVIDLGGLECGNIQLLDFYSGVLNAFYPEEYGFQKGAEFTDEDMVRINTAFIGLIPHIESADGRAKALGLLLKWIAQPEFMIVHEECSGFWDTLVNVEEEWSVTTTFGGSKVTEESFDELMRQFRNSLGNEMTLQEFFGPVDGE